MTESSPVEKIKRESRLLRGTLADRLVDPLTGSIREDDTVLIKFHGSYQQDDRDVRDERRRQKLEPAYSFMIRTRLPGGISRRAMAAARRDCAPLRQRHAASHDPPGIPVPRRDQDRAQVDDAGDQRGADRHGRRLRRRQPQRARECEPGRERAHTRSCTSGRSACRSTCCRARAPITRSGSTARRSSRASEENEPLYGPTYLPRKFKTAIVVPPAQRRRRVRARSRLHRDRREWRIAGLQPDGRRRHGRHARRSGDAIRGSRTSSAS